ncbi:protein tonB2-like isoform X3 [Ornithodoros turicata]|uniref:protein tonB2-like isoform X3 n=1 Tax=Ornithodoros turicata TaxID=34597 RepID=UPI003138E210
MNKAKAAAVKPEPQVEPTRILAETVPLPAEQLAPPPVEQPALPLPEPAPQLEPQPVPEPAPKPTVRLVLPPPARPGQRLIQPTPTRHQPRARTAPSSKEAHPATAAGVIKSAGATALEGAAQQDVNKEQKPGTTNQDASDMPNIPVRHARSDESQDPIPAIENSFKMMTTLQETGSGMAATGVTLNISTDSTTIPA